MDFMDFSRRLYRWASEGVDMYEGVEVETCRKYINTYSVPKRIYTY